MNERADSSRAVSLRAILLLGSSLACGCARPDSPDVSTAAKSSAATASATSSVKLAVVDHADFEATLARLKGKVVLVDYWATWCLPCVEQLPHTFELGRRYEELAVVTVSCDEPAEAVRVAEFLRGQDAGAAINLISRFGGSSQTMEEFEIMSGAVPFYKLYDRSGRLRKTFGIDPVAKKQFTPADIDAAVEGLFAE